MQQNFDFQKTKFIYFFDPKFYVCLHSGKTAIKSYAESDPNLKSAMNILDKTSSVLNGYTQIIAYDFISKLQ